MTTVASIHPVPVESSGAQVARRATAAQRARRFIRVAAVSYAIAIVGVILFSVWVNCWGSFGTVGYLDVREYNDRLVKAEYLDRLPAPRRPSILVLGSSNLMGIRAADITKATGKTAFNAYVSGAMADDFLCILRHLLFDLNHKPQALIVGLDTWSLRPPNDPGAVIPSLRRPLANTPQLVRHHPDYSPLLLTWSKLLECFSRPQLSTAWRMLRDPKVRRSSWPALENGTILEPDGAFIQRPGQEIVFAGRTYRLNESGEFDVTAALKETIASNELHRLKQFPFFDFDGLWNRRVRMLEAFLDLCRDNGVRVVLVVNPIHPVFRAALKENTHYAANQAHLTELIQTWKKKYLNLEVFDATDLASFGGDPNGFFDETHCGVRNSRRLIGHVTELLTTS